MKSERVTEAWEFYRDNCPGFKEPMRMELRKLDEYVSGLEEENAKLREDVAETSLMLGAAWYQCTKLRELFRDFWKWADPPFALRSGTSDELLAIVSRMSKLGVTVDE